MPRFAAEIAPALRSAERIGADDDDAGLVGADGRTETDGDVTTDGETESGGDGDDTTGDDDTTN